MSKVKALEAGADDYLSKPFSHLELFARIKAVLRRTQLPSPDNSVASFSTATSILNFENREVTCNGKR